MNQPTPKSPADAPAGSQDAETAEVAALRALAAWGITAYTDDESMIGGSRNSWVVVDYDQTRPDSPCEPDGPYAVLYLYSDADGEEITVERAPRPGDAWHAHRGDGTGAEYDLLARPADRLGECIDAIAEWITAPPIVTQA
ncbi:hypothetical protein AB0K51_18780 [Kitasatospora sp. NPDC049285]|uniref:hypothetical protein n=1 Tax=Kitasatospora sp. NPDC049285 TaxID=3157096 RepID=UPI00342E723D